MNCNLDRTVFKGAKYQRDVTILKVYGIGENKKIKITTMNACRQTGIEDDEERNPNSSRCEVNEEKLSNNIGRAKSKILEYAWCNPWEYFVTLTFNPAFYNRSDLPKIHKDLMQWFRNYGKKHGLKIIFLLIPELHRDGENWHFHGFIYGLPLSHLLQFKKGDIMGKRLADRVLKGEVIYNWPDYASKFGFCSIEPIKNHEAVSKYVTKYISKNLDKSVKELNAQLYYCSRGLKTAETIKKGRMLMHNIQPDFTNDYCSISWLPYSDDVLESLVNNFYD